MYMLPPLWPSLVRTRIANIVMWMVLDESGREIFSTSMKDRKLLRNHDLPKFVRHLPGVQSCAVCVSRQTVHSRDERGLHLEQTCSFLLLLCLD